MSWFALRGPRRSTSHNYATSFYPHHSTAHHMPLSVISLLTSELKTFMCCPIYYALDDRNINFTHTVLCSIIFYCKIFESLEGSTAVVFELAVFPPRRVDEGFGTDSGFSSESKELTCRVDVSCEDANGMFVSAFKASEQQRKQLEELDRRNKGGIDRSYDVLAEMQNKVGGLGSELQALARRILVSRHLPAEVLRDLGATAVLCCAVLCCEHPLK